MGRRLELGYIEDELGRQLSYAKRRNGLVKKALELCVLCGLDVAFIAFSPSGRLSCFAGDTRIEDVLCRLAKLPDYQLQQEFPIQYPQQFVHIVSELKRQAEQHIRRDSDISAINQEIAWVKEEIQRLELEMSQYKPVADFIMSTEDAECHEARLEATLRNIRERMQELSRNNYDGPQPMDSVAMAGDSSLDGSNGVNTAYPNQESDFRAEDPDESSEAAGVEGGATFANSKPCPSPVSSPEPLPWASAFSGLLNAASPPIPFSPFPEAITPNIALQSYPDQGIGFSYHNQPNARAADDQFNLVRSPELAGAAASYITHQEPPSQNNMSSDGPLNDFSFPAIDFVTSLQPPLAGFEVPQLQQPLCAIALQVSSESSNNVMQTPPLLPLPLPVTASEWTVQDFTMQETVPSGTSSGLAPLQPVTPSGLVTHDLIIQGTADQSGFQTDDGGFQALLNQASPLFSEPPTTPLLPTVRNNQQGLMEATRVGTRLPVNIQGTAPPPSLTAPASSTIQGVEVIQVPAASKYQKGGCSRGRKRKFPWKVAVSLMQSPLSTVSTSRASRNRYRNSNLAPPMLQARAYQNPYSNDQALQTSDQVRGNQNQNSSLVAQVFARARGTRNRNSNLPPLTLTAYVQALRNQNGHSSSAPQIFFHAQGNSNGHFNPAHPAVRPPGNMSYSPVYQHMGLSPDPLMRIFLPNPSSDGPGNLQNGHNN